MDSNLLGYRVRDEISGFEGIAYAEAIYLNGCKRVLIEPTKLKEDGSPVEGCWFDGQQVKLVGSGVSSKKQSTGGPQTAPRRAQDPK